MIAAGLAITPERALHVNFSYAVCRERHRRSRRICRARLKSSDIDALKERAYTIAAVEGSVAVALARRLWPRGEDRGVPLGRQQRREAMLAGEVHGYLEDEPVPTFLALENPDVMDVPTARPLLASRAGFAVNKGDPDFLAFLNAWIYSARGRHVAADDVELLVRVVALAGEIARCAQALTALELRDVARGSVRCSARGAGPRRAARAAHHRHTHAAGSRGNSPGAGDPRTRDTTAAHQRAAAAERRAARAAARRPGRRRRGDLHRRPGLAAARPRQRVARAPGRGRALGPVQRTALPLYDPGRPALRDRAFSRAASSGATATSSCFGCASAAARANEPRRPSRRAAVTQAVMSA